MTEIVSCPACGRKLQVPEDYFGKTVQCPQCQQQFTAEPEGTGISAVPPPPAPPAPAPAPAPPRRYDEDDDLPRHRARRDEDEDDDRDYRGYRNPHRGGMILAFGIVSIAFWPLSFLGLIAWSMGTSDLAAMRSGSMDRSGEGLTQAGRICGMIGSGLFFLVLCGCCCGALGSIQR